MKTHFKTMSESTAEDWQLIAGEQIKFMGSLADRIISHLSLLDQDYGGFPVDRLQHCLQTAHLAAEAGEDDEYVVCALLHDLGDTLGSFNHADVSAAILQPFVSEQNYWMVKHHAIFQGYRFFHYLGLDRNLRDNYRTHEWYDYTEAFVAKYDDPAFDEDAPALSIELFAPLLRKVFSEPRQGLYQAALSGDTQ